MMGVVICPMRIPRNHPLIVQFGFYRLPPSMKLSGSENNSVPFQ